MFVYILRLLNAPSWPSMPLSSEESNIIINKWAPRYLSTSRVAYGAHIERDYIKSKEEENQTVLDVRRHSIYFLCSDSYYPNNNFSYPGTPV